MASVDVNKHELFEILKSYRFVMSNDLVLDSAKLIERTMSVSLTHPISEYLSYEIRNKLLSLKNSWQKTKNSNQEYNFLIEIRNQTCKFQIRNVDIEQNSLMAKFEACKESQNQALIKSKKLELTVKELNEELLALKKQLNTPNIIYMTQQPVTQPVTQSIAQPVTQAIAQPQNVAAPIMSILPAQTALSSTTQSIDPKLSLQNRMDFGSKNTIRSILLKNCYDSMDTTPSDSQYVAPSNSAITITPMNTANSVLNPIILNSNASTIMPASSVLEPFTITPMPAVSSLSSSSFSAPVPIVSKPAVEKSLNLDLTKATTEFIIEQKQQIALMAKQKLEAEKKLSLTPAFSKVGKFSKRKNYFAVSNRQQRRIKTQIKECIQESTKFLKNMGLCLSNVEVNPVEFDQNDFRLKISPGGSENNDLNEPTVNNILYVKDKWAISDRAYNAFRIKCHLNIPTLFHIKKRRQSIDSIFRIRDNEMGVFMSIKEKLKFCLEKFFERKYGPDDVNDPTKFKDNIIHVKLGADGTNIGRNLKLLNFTITIINEGVKAKSATGNYTIGIFEIENENYAAVQVCFKELIEEMEQLKEMKVGKNTLQLIYYLAADWKMLAHLLGIQSANSKYPCVWCKCNKEEFFKVDKEWSITDPNLGCRTHEEHAAILNHTDRKKIVSYGYEKQPIFKDIIPICRYMIDMLHLFLRVSDTLFNLLVKDCSLADKFDMGAISKFDVSSYKHMNSLQHFLNEKCNVRFTFLWVAETKKLTWRDLVGPEKIKLFENFNLAEIIPGHENFKNVEKIWNEFYELMTLVKQCQIDSVDLKERTGEWLKLFLKVYNKTTVTPYMHAFVQHLHEFVFLYKDINAFNCQGLEKLNDMTTGQYFKGTNKHETALHQILKKRNRIEYLAAFVEKKEDES